MRVLLVLCMVFYGMGCKPSQSKKIAQQAYDYTEAIVEIGPRNPGSQGIEQVRNLIRKTVSTKGFILQEQTFDASTPEGVIEMNNLFFEIPGSTNKKIILGAHYDSKYMGSIEFVGANDAASSVALLLALAPWFKEQQLASTLEIVFFDGEEAIGNRWSHTDSLYGSRHYVEHRNLDPEVQAVLILDMISDFDLELIRSQGSDPGLLKLLEDILKDLSKSDLLAKKWSYVEDDHIPFVQKGYAVLHLMDFTFGGDQSPGIFWHTSKDNMDQVSKKSLETMAEILMRLVPEISLRQKKNSLQR